MVNARHPASTSICREPGWPRAAGYRPVAWLVFLLLTSPLAGLFPAPAVAAVTEQRDEWINTIAGSPLAAPLHVESSESRNAVQGSVHASLPYSFETLATELHSVAAWCEISFLHLNIKACLYDGDPAADSSIMQLYVGRKRYQLPETADVVELRLQAAKLAEDHLALEIFGDRGPHGSRDFRLHLQIIPYSADESLIHLRYSLRFGLPARIAMRIYFATGGRNRVGFTVEDYDHDGEPVHVGGLRGVIERNVMRFYLALQAHLETREIPGDEQLQARLRRWFELTERYPRQLHELDRESYLKYKQREYANQEALQKDPASLIPAKQEPGVE